jgi:hypothetical protein
MGAAIIAVTLDADSFMTADAFSVVQIMQVDPKLGILRNSSLAFHRPVCSRAFSVRHAARDAFFHDRQRLVEGAGLIRGHSGGSRPSSRIAHCLSVQRWCGECHILSRQIKPLIRAPARRAGFA